MERKKRNSGEQFFTRKCCFCKIFELSVLLALTVLSDVDCQSPVFLVNPVSVAAVDGTTVEFSCTVEDVDIISYRVNGSSASGEDVEGKGFIQLTEELLGGTVRRRNLTVAVSSQYNNSEIFCRGFGTDVNVNSEIAMLTVQGPLSSVGDLSSSFIDSSTVHISWSPPFTLPGTAITGYNISVTSNGMTNNYFTSNSYYVLQLSNITDSPCNEINITVSGYNGLNGEMSLPLILYLPSVPSPYKKIPISVVDQTEVDNMVNVTLQINVTNLCPGEYPDFIDIHIFFDNYTFIALQENVSISVITLLTDVTEFTLIPDQTYTAIVHFENTKGEFNITSTVNFSTHAIQSIRPIDVTGPTVMFECDFAPNTGAIACIVDIILPNKQVIERMWANRTGNIAVVTFRNVFAGEYILAVFEVENDGTHILVLMKSITVTLMTSTSERMLVISTQLLLGISELSFASATSSLFTSPEQSVTIHQGGKKRNVFIIAITIGVAFVIVIIILVVLPVLCVVTKKRNITTVELKHNSEESYQQLPSMALKGRMIESKTVDEQEFQQHSSPMTEDEHDFEEFQQHLSQMAIPDSGESSKSDFVVAHSKRSKFSNNCEMEDTKESVEDDSDLEDSKEKNSDEVPLIKQAKAQQNKTDSSVTGFQDCFKVFITWPNYKADKQKEHLEDSKVVIPSNRRNLNLAVVTGVNYPYTRGMTSEYDSNATQSQLENGDKGLIVVKPSSTAKEHHRYTDPDEYEREISTYTKVNVLKIRPTAPVSQNQFYTYSELEKKKPKETLYTEVVVAKSGPKVPLTQGHSIYSEVDHKTTDRLSSVPVSIKPPAIPPKHVQRSGKALETCIQAVKM